MLSPCKLSKMANNNLSFLLCKAFATNWNSSSARSRTDTLNQFRCQGICLANSWGLRCQGIETNEIGNIGNYHIGPEQHAGGIPTSCIRTEMMRTVLSLSYNCIPNSSLILTASSSNLNICFPHPALTLATPDEICSQPNVVSVSPHAPQSIFQATSFVSTQSGGWHQEFMTNLSIFKDEPSYKRKDQRSASKKDVPTPIGVVF